MSVEELKPITWRALRAKEREKYKGITAEEAFEQLKSWGYTPDTWDKLLESGDRSLGSHEVRVLISIARGEQPFVEWD